MHPDRRHKPAEEDLNQRARALSEQICMYYNHVLQECFPKICTWMFHLHFVLFHNLTLSSILHKSFMHFHAELTPAKLQLTNTPPTTVVNIFT